MNKIHGNFRIPNEDFIFVLSTLIFYPIDWMEKYGWRKMLDKEKQALFLFYREVGLRMGMQDLPATIEDLRAFVTEYEAKYFVFAQSNRNIADATINIFKGWFPGFLRPLIEPAVVALIDEKLRIAFGFPKPSPLMVWLVNASLLVRKHFLRWLPVTFMPYPNLTDTTRFETYYPRPIEIEAIRPSYMPERMPPTK
ncbi:MAG: oxygenase MpaB family protein [Saprospiraceae bacterium]